MILLGGSVPTGEVCGEMRSCSLQTVDWIKPGVKKEEIKRVVAGKPEVGKGRAREGRPREE